MNFKTTSILLVLLAALGTYLFLTRDQGAETSTDTAQAKKLITITPADITSLTVTPADEKPMTFTRDGNEWKISAPIASPAESGLVQALASELTNLESQNITDITDGTGLKTPRFVVDINTRDGKTTTINVGDKSGVGERLYVQLKGNTKADVVQAGLEEQLDKPLDDFRQKKMVALNAPDIKYVSIERQGVKLEMVKSGEKWQVTSPESMLADTPSVTDVLTAIANLRAEEFVDGAATNPMFGFGDEVRTITVSTAAPATQPSIAPAAGPTTQPAPIKILVGLPDSVLQKSVYATVAGSNVIVKVAKPSLAFLDKKPLEFRDKLVLDVDPKSVNKLTVTIDRPATTQPTTMPAEKTVASVMRRPPPATQPITPATTQSTTQASTKPAAPPQSVWISPKPTVDPKGTPSIAIVSANDATVEGVLASLHPLRAEKYVEAAPTAGTTITVTIDTGGGGVFVLGKTEFQITDPGPAKTPVATYNGLHFEIERALLDKLEADFTKPAAPTSARPEPGPEMGPQMGPQMMP
ncbi:hypothetical protein BH10PLA1_BH10PLA1_03990 [soil metagenome]